MGAKHNQDALNLRLEAVAYVSTMHTSSLATDYLAMLSVNTREQAGRASERAFPCLRR